MSMGCKWFAGVMKITPFDCQIFRQELFRIFSTIFGESMSILQSGVSKSVSWNKIGRKFQSRKSGIFITPVAIHECQEGRVLAGDDAAEIFVSEFHKYLLQVSHPKLWAMTAAIRKNTAEWVSFDSAMNFGLRPTFINRPPNAAPKKTTTKGRMNAKLYATK